MLLVVHATLAQLSGIKELELDDDEARKLSEASKEVLKHYPLGVSEKTLAWVNLTVVAGGIYGIRFMAWNVRKSAEKRARTITLTPAPGSSGQAAGQAPSAPPPNGHAANNLDLTPPFLTVPPEGETIL